MIVSDRLPKYLKENEEYLCKHRPVGVDLYYEKFIHDVQVTLTTRTACSNNNFIIEYEEGKENMEHCDIEVVGLLGEDYTVHEQSRRVSSTVLRTQRLHRQ